jgi:hypothetical protein
VTGTGASYVVAGAERSSAVLKPDNWPNAELALCASRRPSNGCEEGQKPIFTISTQRAITVLGKERVL